jgi:hypothetical protein
MIANAICDYLEKAKIGLVKGKNLFAGLGIGEDKQVVVSETSVNTLLDDNYSVREASMNIVVANYPVKEGQVLAEKICKLMTDLSTYTYTYEGYTIECIAITATNFPTQVAYLDKRIFTMNFLVKYKITI